MKRAPLLEDLSGRLVLPQIGEGEAQAVVNLVPVRVQSQGAMEALGCRLGIAAFVVSSSQGALELRRAGFERDRAPVGVLAGLEALEQLLCNTQTVMRSCGVRAQLCQALITTQRRFNLAAD